MNNISLALDKLKLYHFFLNYTCIKKEDGSITKPPVDPHNINKFANISDPTCMVDFATAKSNVGIGNCRGVGIVLNDCSKIEGYEEYTLVGIDIDSHQCDKNQYFDDIYNLFFGAYCEFSPSGNGYHFLFMVKKEAIPVNYKADYFVKNGEKEIECYVGGITNRYLTLTGNSVAPYSEDLIEDRTDEWLQFLDIYMKREKALPTTTVCEANLSINEGLEILRISKNGERFCKLYDLGDASDYPSESEGRMHLCGMLAFIFGKDRDKVLEAYKASAIYQKRPDKAHDLACVDKAIASCTSVYTKKINIPESVTTSAQNTKVEDYICLTKEKILSKILEIDPDSNPKYSNWNDISNANLFIEIVKKEACYVPEAKSWFVYNGIKWEKDLDNLKIMELMQLVAEAIEEYFNKKIIPEYAKKLNLTNGDEIKRFRDSKMKIVKNWLLLQKRKNYLEDAKSLNNLPYTKFDADKHLFNVKNGTIHLFDDGSFEFRQHSPADHCAQASDVIYNPNASYNRWYSFLNEIMEGNSEKIEFLQKIFGYSLSGDTNYECFFMLLGTKTRNGKSTFLDAVQLVYGDYGTAGNAETIMQERPLNASGPSEDLARLKEIRFLNIPEPKESMVLNVAIVKRMTGNDPIACRFLHQNTFTYMPKFKFFLNTNHEPVVNDDTLFSSNRIHIITFDRHFEEDEQDTHLKEKLISDQAQSTILNWLLDGWKALKEKGLAAPKAVKIATENYKKSQDRISQFIDECFERIPNELEKSVDAFEGYKLFMLQNNYKALGQNKWKLAMERAGVQFDKKRMPSSSSPTTVLCNMKLKDEWKRLIMDRPW